MHFSLAMGGGVFPPPALVQYSLHSILFLECGGTPPPPPPSQCVWIYPCFSACFTMTGNACAVCALVLLCLSVCYLASSLYQGVTLAPYLGHFPDILLPGKALGCLTRTSYSRTFFCLSSSLLKRRIAQEPLALSI